MRRTIARRARLETELAAGGTIAMPPELRDEPDAVRLIAEEMAVMTARRDALQSQLAALAELKNLYAKEVQSLENKMAIQEKQISLARRELKNVGSLVEKGLAVSSRELTLQQMVADLESRMLDFQTAAVRAKQEIGKAERDSVDLQQERKAKIMEELQDARAAIEQLGTKLQTSRALIDEASITAPRLAFERSSRDSQPPRYSVVRRIGGISRETRVEESASVEPGDVVRVDRGGGDPSALAPHQAVEREGGRESRWR
jgi:polysaccharide biosynthesis/export protein ExoF